MPMPQEKSLKSWYNFVGERNCLGCQVWPVQLAHIRLMISPKTGEMLPRRKGINEWAVIPLCEGCHMTRTDSIHKVGETRWMENNEWSQDKLLRWWTSLFLDWFINRDPGKE